MDIQNKINALLRYREMLDEDEREVFDMLVGHAREVALQAA